MPDVAQHLELSHKLVYTDLDWALARQHGITDRERECLQYFADIESQTPFYMLEVAHLEVAQEPELIAFLTMWNYEEFFHAHAITRFLEEVGVEVPAPAERGRRVRDNHLLRAKVELFVEHLFARVAKKSFVALWQAWGAAAELLTTQAYEELARLTKNPVLHELCKRIAKQERRHFAWYYEAARERLTRSPFAPKLVRAIFEYNWTPVGSGVKSPAEGAGLIARLFPGQRVYDVFGTIDHRMSMLPGFEGFTVCSRYADRLQKLLPPEARVVREGGPTIATEDFARAS